jgi:tRNA (cytidine/uridine-2'-O-)-methyltransferase
MMRIALYQPDIAQNTGTILRLAACLGVEAHIIEPAGFLSSDRAFRRAGMDYLDHVALVRHASWAAFAEWRSRLELRLILFTTRAETVYTDFAFLPDDLLLFGQEISRRGGGGLHCRGRAAADSDSLRLAFDQCGDELRDGARGSVAADRRVSQGKFCVKACRICILL